MASASEDDSVLGLVNECMENTAAHGIPNITRARTPLRRVVWAMLFLFGFLMFTLQALQLTLKYFNYDVDINYEIGYQKRVEFPSVTFCNMNPIKSLYLKENEDLFNLLYSGDTKYANSTWNRQVSDNTTTLKSSTPISTDKEKYKDWDEVDYLSEDDEYYKILTTRDIIAQLPYKDRRASGHEITDMLLDCSFNGYPCSPVNFTYFYNYRYGNCFTFNGLNSTEALHTTRPGPLYGLSMMLYIEQEEYEQYIQPSAGIRITVHPKNIMPFPEDDGVSISPGQESSIGLKRRHVTHIPSPYSNCTPVNNISRENVFLRKFPGIVHNMDTCEKSCFYYELLTQCNCSDPRYRYYPDKDVCWSNSENDSKRAKCTFTAEEDFVKGKPVLGCNCSPPCSDTSYETTVSAALWPNEKRKQDVIDATQNTEQLKEYYDNPTFIENNFAKVLVFFNELQYEHIYDTEKYLWYDLMSDLGGQFGLWIGVSVLTIFEFVELVCDILMYQCKMSKKKKIEVHENHSFPK